MDRRQFMQLSAAGVLGLALEGKAEARDYSYSLVILGDTHFDQGPDSVYHEGYNDPNPTREANHRKEFVRNYEMWSHRMPKLLKRASYLIDGKTKAVLHMGDLIQGDCNSVEAHTRMLDDAFNRIKSIMGPLPLVTVAGNHDKRGSRDADAIEAYDSYMPARLSKELGQDISKTTYSFWIGPDVFIGIDFNHPDDDELDKILKESRGARYTFVIVHGPIFPYQSDTYNWIFHGRDGNAEARAHFRKLFAQRKAIVLCGHTHTTELHDWYGEGGRITQMTMNSVWSNDFVGKYEKEELGGAENYEAIREMLTAQAGTKRSDAELAMFREIAPGLKRFSFSRACGSYKMNISKKGVSIDFYAGDSTQKSECFIIR